MNYNPNQSLVSAVVENGSTATSTAGNIYSQFESLVGNFSKWTNSNLMENGDNYAPAPARLHVPSGYFAKVTCTLKVDDWGKIIIIPVDSDAEADDITVLNMTSEVVTPGIRGGHVLWERTSTILLPAGLYDIYVQQDNAEYNDNFASEASMNRSFCEVSISFTYDTVPTLVCPLLINAVLSQYHNTTDERTDAELAMEPTSYCASGFMYRGYLNVHYSDGSVQRIPAQSGGWVNAKESPFKAPKDKENHDPYQWPDTACPTCLATPAGKDYSGIDSTASGSTNGYMIYIDENESRSQVEDAAVGRTYIKLHLAKRIGSEGCISTMEWYGNQDIDISDRANPVHNPLWFELVNAMKNAQSKLRNPIPFTIRYVGVQPNYNRIPSGAEYYQNQDLSNL